MRQSLDGSGVPSTLWLSVCTSRMGWEELSPEVKVPINLRFGRQRIKIGYEIRRPDGTTILTAPIPRWGLHLSFHPSGVIKVSDRFGFERRIDVLSPEFLEGTEDALSEFVEDFLDSTEDGPEFDEDLIAFGNFGAFQGRVMRRTAYGLDFNPFGATKAAGFGFPFVFVDADAVSEYIDTVGSSPTVLIAPESERMVIAQDASKTMSFEFDFKHPTRFLQRLPLGNEIAQAFTETLGYIENTSETLEIDPSEYLATQLRGLDTERFGRDALAALGAPTQPFIKRFTREGFEPLPL